MTQPGLTQAILWADEASFGDSSNTTFDDRAPILGPVTIPTLQSKVPSGRAMTYVNDVERHIRGPYEPSFTIELALTGYGSTTAGSLSAATDLGLLLGYAIGNQDNAQVGGTVAAAPTSATQFGIDGDTLQTNGLIRVGAAGDGGGEGQWAAVNNTTTATMLTALPATPAENDVVYASELIYPEEDATSSANVFTGLRMQFQSAGAIYRAWGCVATALSFTMPVGAVPKVAITYAAAKMIPIGSAPTWPPATAKDEFSGQPIGGGSLFLQDHGTATRATKTITDFTLDVDLGTSLIRGHGTADVYQNIIKAVRTKCQASFSFTTLSDASGTNTEYDAWNSDTGNLKHALYGASVGRDGASLGFYFPYCTQVGAAPSQVIEGDVNRIRSSFLCGTNTVTTNSLTLANFVIGLG